MCIFVYELILYKLPTYYKLQSKDKSSFVAQKYLSSFKENVNCLIDKTILLIYSSAAPP